MNKNTLFNKDVLTGDFRDSLYVEGHFETEKYFNNHTIINNVPSNPTIQYCDIELQNIYRKNFSRYNGS